MKKLNEGKFFKAHEIFEDIWFDVRGNTREFYQGLVHISVALYHLNTRKNLTGAVLQFKKAKSKLDKYIHKKNKELPDLDLKKLIRKTKRLIKKEIINKQKI